MLKKHFLKNKTTNKNMLLPSIMCKMGEWNYYVSSMTFEQVSKLIKMPDDEMHKSKGLKEQLQRSVTDNVDNISRYLLTQKKERFFNSLVLAVYDGDPEWVEVELNYKNEDFFNLGFLNLSGTEKIFPVDGQHRVEGIKDALEKDASLATEQVSVILVGHKKSEPGMIKSRRLFATLNRAKPVSIGDKIALDEDDTAAIITRELLESHVLFTEKKIIVAKQKAMPERDKTAFTSLVTFYQCNLSLVKAAHESLGNKKLTGKALQNFLVVRPEEEQLEKFSKYITSFWDDMVSTISVLDTYSKDTSEQPAKKLRNSSFGGHLLFRPVSLVPFIDACITINKLTKLSYRNIFKIAQAKVEMDINKQPWLQIIWNGIESKMIMNTPKLIESIILHMINPNYLSELEKEAMIKSYAAAINFENELDDTNKIKLLKQIKKKL